MPYVSDVAVEPIVRFEVGSFEMFKKFVSNALLSIVVDKKARDKMSAANEPKVTSIPDVENVNIPSMTPRWRPAQTFRRPYPAFTRRGRRPQEAHLRSSGQCQGGITTQARPSRQSHAHHARAGGIDQTGNGHSSIEVVYP